MQGVVCLLSNLAKELLVLNQAIHPYIKKEWMAGLGLRGFGQEAMVVKRRWVWVVAVLLGLCAFAFPGPSLARPPLHPRPTCGRLHGGEQEARDPVAEWRPDST